MMRFAVLAAAVVLGGAAVRADDAPKPPAVQKEHELLKAFAGEWDLKGEMTMAPGQPPITTTGTETCKLVGGFWVVSEIKGECMGQAMTGLMTVGFDPAKKKYVGTWVCSMCDHLWTYEGSAEGKALTLLTEGPNPAGPGKTAKMKDVTEWVSPDERTLTSYALSDDGKWVPFMKMTAKRKK